MSEYNLKMFTLILDWALVEVCALISAILIRGYVLTLAIMSYWLFVYTDKVREYQKYQGCILFFAYEFSVLFIRGKCCDFRWFPFESTYLKVWLHLTCLIAM